MLFRSGAFRFRTSCDPAPLGGYFEHLEVHEFNYPNVKKYPCRRLIHVSAGHHAKRMSRRRRVRYEAAANSVALPPAAVVSMQIWRSMRQRASKLRSHINGRIAPARAARARRAADWSCALLHKTTASKLDRVASAARGRNPSIEPCLVAPDRNSVM